MSELITLTPKTPDRRLAHLVLAHGASQPMTSPFFETLCGMLVEEGLGVTRFEFAYMAQRRHGGKRRPPPRVEMMFPEFLQVIEALRAELPDGQGLMIGGKSMGGRIASMMADDGYADGKIEGLVCLGYPFHPTGKPDKLRTSHLETLRCPALFVHGERDPFGTRQEVEGYPLSSSIDIQWAIDGDHDLGPRGGQGVTRKENLFNGARAIVAFAKRLSQMDQDAR